MYGAIHRDKIKYKTSKSEIIDLKFIEELLDKQNGKCYWFNIDLDLNRIKKENKNPSKLTIDRLDCSKGYSKDNVVISSYAANCGRANCSIEDWLCIIENIKNGLNEKKDN